MRNINYLNPSGDFRNIVLKKNGSSNKLQKKCMKVVGSRIIQKMIAHLYIIISLMLH